ncbi:MAG: SRPBCC domain-containing protein [Leptolyngbyaceae cyanobacterium SM1_1_3]|nr:SRPBCC domain-containing protein [Leptolyngbyaceae cyanobacterium SM1_1_3]NJM85149.1 SRPBCC domain-containing protein [Leptolyngbyaceae cyanobacterium RM2_2_21]NJN04984.1 SRPBCC domain-containing protein [Leptolyngbyaceae cyanobacterium RM1_1_2]NJO08933.1 SRPBCC domain-containing protein [Leptolyngbyaceae cyanobacterium SL_1_1]
MPSLYIEIEIEASRAKVWQALIKKENWYWWNTFLFDCDPQKTFQLGQSVLLALQRTEGEEESEFQPTVVRLQPNLYLQWVSTAPGFKSEHIFELQDIGIDRTKYIHRERLSGLLSGLFLTFLRQDEKRGLQRMARQLKRYVEQGSRPLNQRDRGLGYPG